MDNLLIVIPATKKNAVIPDQLIKKLNGVTLIKRAINLVLKITPNKEQILIITDSDEISLIAQRNKIPFKKDALLSLNSDNIIQEVINRTSEYHQRNILLYRGNTPILGKDILKDAYKEFLKLKDSVLVSVKKETRKVYEINEDELEKIENKDLCEEIGAFYIFDKNSIIKSNSRRVPYIISDEESIEIKNYQSWWVCEKILQRKKIVFNVVGNTDIGMGHIYRSLNIAHDISDHEIVFVCDKKYELAVKKITSMDYKVITSNDVKKLIFDLNPDMVINDTLNTSDDFISKLKDKEIMVVNFEDLGSGSKYADIVINELYEKPQKEGSHYYWGHEYITLRDEFYDIKPNLFENRVQQILIMFGGTDQNNLTLKTLKSIDNICQEKNIKINIICGAGYLFLNELNDYLNKSEYKNIFLHYSIASVSEIMSKSQLAISSNGRAVFELAEMNIPSIIISHHERENTHNFATLERGFVNIGVINKNTIIDIQTTLFKLVNDRSFRKLLYTNLSMYSFIKNKEKVLKLITNKLT
jgi:spore coat polysaccharide biosynthesis predicted glycosyltransferase SpsG/CMP-N-acetylneuraminic acid synthetase